MIFAQLSSEPIDADALVQMARSSRAGGVVLFEGTTRSVSAYGEVVALEYEAYRRRAQIQLEQIAADAIEKWQLESAVVVHRTGMVKVGEPGVVLVAVAAHRGEAFDACRWMIDTLKSEVAIWKREIYSDDSSTWIGSES